LGSSCVLVGKSSVGQWHLLGSTPLQGLPGALDGAVSSVTDLLPVGGCWQRSVWLLLRSVPFLLASLASDLLWAGPAARGARHPEQIKMPRNGQQGVRQRFSNTHPQQVSSKPTGNLGGTLAGTPATSTGSKRWVEGGFVYETDHLGRTTRDPLTTAPLR
jgi:hypothetical protein